MEIEDLTVSPMPTQPAWAPGRDIIFIIRINHLDDTDVKPYEAVMDTEAFGFPSILDEHEHGRAGSWPEAFLDLVEKNAVYFQNRPYMRVAVEKTTVLGGTRTTIWEGDWRTLRDNWNMGYASSIGQRAVGL